MIEIATPLPFVPVVDCPIFSGPRKTERFGTALAIDLGSHDLALAVSRDNRMPRASVVVTTAARNMIRTSKAGEKAESIVVYGSASDPTNHPSVREIVENVRDLRNKWFAKAKLCLICHAPLVDDADLRHVLGVFDRVYLRMEWGTAKTFAAMTGRKSTEFASFLSHLGHLQHLVVTARFLKATGADNSSDAEIRNWIKKLTELKPREVLLLHSENARLDGKKAKSLTKTRLMQIAQEVTAKVGVPAAVQVGDVPLA